MKKITFLMSLVAMMVVSLGVKAQEVSIELISGWTWISYPSTDTLDFATALGSFTPTAGDVIKSQWGSAIYRNGQWKGTVSQFYPGYGYHYKSNRPVSVTLTLGTPLPQLFVTTAEPTDITAISAMVGGTVDAPEGTHVFLRGVCWGMEPNPDIDGNHTSEETGIGSFSSTLEGLSLNTVYYVRAYAVTDYGLAYGEELSFTTKSGIPEVSTSEVTDITASTAICGGTVIDDGGLDITACGFCWNTEPNPTIDGNHTSEETGMGSFSTQLTRLNPNKAYYVRAYASNGNVTVYGNEVTFTTLDYDYVDLGLPSGTLWATCNVGAASSEDYGDYFAWGETQPKDSYFWDTYQHCNGSNSTLTKYCNNSEYGYNGFSDDLTTLLPEDDAATVNWGSEWRMPIKAEWEELYNNTTQTWSTQNGVRGQLFTASNGNSLFLPAAGCYFENSILNAGSDGNYWSNRLETESPFYAWDFYFFWDDCSMSNDDRYSGRSVRPVRSSVQNNAPTGAIDGKFTINSDGDQVYFSQGNLQYIGSASTPYWKFAENQWDCLGITTEQNSNSQTVDRDLFGWGTSGWNCGNNCYHPWDTYNSSGSSYGPAGANNLSNTYANSDWGIYNSISNGGNQPNQWRTLGKEEWAYVFDSRTTNSGIRFAKAKVNDMNGVILLPDDWDSLYYDLNETNTKDASYTSNTVNVSDWDFLERLGAIFLPATGYRFGISVKNVGSRGYYWSSSFVNSNYAYGVYFYDADNASDMNPQDCSNRTYGRSVRLVRVVE